ncbi:hypothetical protein EFQ99_16475 [Rhizobium vallis]|uniref:Uncharacterized protein n=2 Tax=Rhizobium vallis TaxID=634290 RepID=A0A432PJ17_9HYPH|nr:hypothetical protein EFQ99_16475 [Rhizobium vallis]
MTSCGEYGHVEMLRAYAEVEASLNVIDKVIDALPIEFRWLARLVGSSTIAPEAAVSLTEARVRHLWEQHGFDGTVSKLSERPFPVKCDAGYLLVIQLNYVREAILKKNYFPIESRPAQVFLDCKAMPITVVSVDTALHEAAVRAEVAMPITLAVISETFRQSLEVFIPF